MMNILGVVMKKLEKIRKVIVSITVAAVLMDLIIGLLDPAYKLSTVSLFTLGFVSHSLMKEYEKHKSGKEKFSKGVVFLSVVVMLISIYRLLNTHIFAA